MFLWTSAANHNAPRPRDQRLTFATKESSSYSELCQDNQKYGQSPAKKTNIFFCTLWHAQIIMASINSAVQQHAYLTATPTGHMVFDCISPLAIYTNDNGPAAPSIITPYITDACQPWTGTESSGGIGKKKKMLLRTRSAGTQVGQFKSSGQSGPLTQPERTSLVTATGWTLTF